MLKDETHPEKKKKQQNNFIGLFLKKKEKIFLFSTGFFLKKLASLSTDLFAFFYDIFQNENTFL